MKNKIITSLLLTVVLGLFAAIFAIHSHSVESSGNTLPLNKVWTFQADDRILSTPILIGDQIIFRTANKIYSISTLNGSTKWETSARASDMTINVNYLRKPMAGNSEFLVSEEQNNSISIYSTKTGEKLWTLEGQANFINAMELVNGILIVARHDGNLAVYDLASHQMLWEIALPSRSGTPIAVNPDLVIVGMSDVLRVYGLTDGNLLNETTYDSSLINEIALDGANILVSVVNDGDAYLFSLQLDTLDKKWAYHIGEAIDTDLSIAADHLSLFDKALVLLNTKSGSVVWKDDTEKYYSAPAYYENSLFFISVHRRFSNNKEICKVEIGEDTVKRCSLVESTGRFVTSPDYLLGPLTSNGLLIAPRGSEIVAFIMP